MKGALGVLGLLLALAAVSVLVKKQVPATAKADAAQQPQQIQQKVRQQVEAALQQPRTVPDEP